MKTLIIGETSNNELSSGTLEIISKATDLNLDFTVITVGNSDPSNIGSNDFSNIYFKLNTNKLNLSNCADEIKSFIEKNEIKLVLSNSSYIGRDIIAFLSIDFNTSPVSNVTNFEISNNELTTINLINGGESEYKATITSDVKLLLVRPKSFEQKGIQLSDNFETNIITDNENSIDVFDIHIEEKTGPQLEDSKIVISAGRGMVDVENLTMIINGPKPTSKINIYLINISKE